MSEVAPGGRRLRWGRVAAASGRRDTPEARWDWLPDGDGSAHTRAEGRELFGERAQWCADDCSRAARHARSLACGRPELPAPLEQNTAHAHEQAGPLAVLETRRTARAQFPLID